MLNLLPLNLQFFNDEGDDNSADQTANSGGQDQTQEQDQSATDGQQSEDKTFTQEDVNNVVTKETRKQQEKLLKDLGVTDFKDAKEGMKKLKEFQDAQKTDAEKQQEQLETLSNQKDTLSSENASLKAQVSAMKQGVDAESVEDVVALAERQVSDDVSIDDAIKAVVDKYPHFSAQGDAQEEKNPNYSTGNHKNPQGSTDSFLSGLKGEQQ